MKGGVLYYIVHVMGSLLYIKDVMGKGWFCEKYIHILW